VFRPPTTPLKRHGATVSVHFVAPSIVKSMWATFPDETVTSQVTLPETVWPSPGEVVLTTRLVPALAGSATTSRTATKRR
jgi:hypothetical protein